VTETTALDIAHAAMVAAPDEDAARLAFYERLASCELFLMLEAEPQPGQDQISPQVFELEDANYVLVFDREVRLAAFAGQAAAYVALSGRTLTEMVAGQNIGLGVNLDVAPSSILLPPDAVDWLNETLGNRPDEVQAHITEVSAPTGLPDQLLTALDGKLATAMGLAQVAYLCAVRYETGGRGHLLAFVGALPHAQQALAQAGAEALTFSGLDAAAMDIGFFHPSDPIVAKLERLALRFDLPQMQHAVTNARPAPGSDPAKPPKLK